MALLVKKVLGYFKTKKNPMATNLEGEGVRPFFCGFSKFFPVFDSCYIQYIWLPPVLSVYPHLVSGPNLAVRCRKTTFYLFIQTSRC